MLPQKCFMLNDWLHNGVYKPEYAHYNQDVAWIVFESYVCNYAAAYFIPASHIENVREREMNKKQDVM